VTDLCHVAQASERVDAKVDMHASQWSVGSSEGQRAWVEAEAQAAWLMTISVMPLGATGTHPGLLRGGGLAADHLLQRALLAPKARLGRAQGLGQLPRVCVGVWVRADVWVWVCVDMWVRVQRG
jgi:hypothetical protein